MRIPWLRSADLDEEQRALYDAILGSPRGSGPGSIPLTDPEGRLYGPFNPLLLSPKLGNALQEFGSQVRFATSLTARHREIAILELARNRESEFEWYAHARAGSAAGLTDGELDALRTGATAPTFDREDRLVRETTHTLVVEGDLTKSQFDDLVEHFDLRRAIDLVILVGYYEMLALLLKTTRTALPEGADPVFGADPEAE